jgi:hypothetical protein
MEYAKDNVELFKPAEVKRSLLLNDQVLGEIRARHKKKVTLTYSRYKRDALLTYHKSLKTSDPYFQFTAPSNTPRERALLEAEIGELQVRVGSLAAFTDTEIAAITNEQIFSYLQQGTMADFPIEDTEAMNTLNAVMIGGCSPNDIYISFTKKVEEGEFEPVAGGKIILGKSDQTIKELNGKPETSLSTLYAIHLREEQLDAIKALSESPEKEAASICRLFRTASFRASKPLGKCVLAYFGQALIGSGIKWVICDTHIPSIIQFLQEQFGAICMNRAKDIELTPHIMQNIVKPHYAGYKDDIIVLAIEADSYIEGSTKFLQQHNMPLITT